MSNTQTMPSLVMRPPRADGLPLVGSLIPLLGDPIKFMTAQYLKHGPVFTVHVLNKQFTVLAGPEAVEYMANEDNTLTGEMIWRPFATQFGGRNTLTSLDGEEHSRLRKVMRRGFSRSAALDTIPITVETTRRMLQAHRPGDQIAVADFAVSLIAEVIGSITLGHATGNYLPDFITVWRSYLWSHVVGSKPKTIMDSPQVKQALSRIIEFAQQIVANYERGELKPGDSQFADDLIKAAQEQPDLITQGDLILGLISPYVAGLDTVASIVLFMLYEIIRNPALHARLKPETEALFANGVPNADQLRQVPILRSGEDQG